MRIRFGLDFDNGASGLHMPGNTESSALSTPVNAPVLLAAGDSFYTGAPVASGGTFGSFGSSFGTHAELVVSGADAGAGSGWGDLTGADSPDGHFDSAIGGLSHEGAGVAGDSVNGASGAGLTARISQSFNSGNGRYEFSGNRDIDAVLIGSKWTITNITYSFPTSGSFYGSAASYYNSTLVNNQVVFNAAQKTAVQYALGLIASYTGLTFTQVTETNSTHGNLRFSQASAGITSAEGNFPGSDSWDGDIWFNSGASSPQPFYQTPQIGNWGQATIMHEIGHTMGLKHGHQDYTSQDLTPPGYVDGPGPRYGSVALDQAHNGQDWTLMTYITDPTDNPHHFGGEGFNQPQTYMQNDIAALQYLYGANFNYRSTNTTYTFNATTGEMFVNGVGQGQPTQSGGIGRISRTIWDGNGIDTYDFSNFANNQDIDLTPGGFSTFSTAQLVNHQAASGGTATAEGNIANALLYNNDVRSLIENVNTGAGNDHVYGNQADNTIHGNAGNDSLFANSGNDTLYGDAGNDTLDGWSGDDVLFGGDGNDLVYGYTGNDFLYGQNGDDTLRGETGNDYLSGSTGNDSMVGASGDDTYLVDAIGDTVVEASGEGQDQVYSSISYTLTANVEDLSLTGSADINGTGNALDNTIWGNSGDNVLLTGGGTDIVHGNTGNDTITSSGYGEYYGDAGDDYIYAGNGGTETLDGGANTDTLNTTAWSGDYNINMVTGVTNWSGESFVNFENLITGAGNDYITGTAGNNIISTGLGNDTVYGNGYSGGTGDSIDGGDGNDEIHSSGRGTYLGGAGNDTLFAGAGVPETLDGGAGIDLLDTTTWSGSYVIDLNTGVTNYATESFINFENVTTGIGNDSVTATAGDNVINTGAGNDTIWAGGFASAGDTVDSGDGNDVIHSSGRGTYNAGLGNDTVFAGLGSFETLDGGGGIDLLDITSYTGNYAVNLATGVTNFSPEAFTNFENLQSGIGNDTLVGTSGANLINGGAGNDDIDGGAGNDTLNGEAGNDYLHSTGGGTKTYKGGAGNDTVGGSFTYGSVLDGGADVDTLDLVWVGSSLTPIVVNLAAGTYTDGIGSFTMTNFENYNGFGSAETITGTSGANVLSGNGGNDTINAGDGVDSVYGGDGDDVLDGSYGWDTVIDGGNGSDTVDYSWITAGFDSTNIVIDLSAGGWTSTEGTESLVSIESVLGTQSNETINGTAGANRLDGNGGDDTLNGGAGVDTLNGGAGNDSINAGGPGSGNDTVNGGAGDDWIQSSGNGSYSGGLGNDTIVAESTGFGNSEVIDGGDGIDSLDLTAYGLPYIFDMATGVTNYSPDYGESFINFENVTTGASADNITGNASDNLIDVGSGNDTVAAGDGNDTVEGRDGDDTIYGGTGDDVLNGGAGNDTIVAGAVSDGTDSVDGGAGDDVLTSSGNGTVLGGIGNDYVYAGLTSNTETLDGGDGIDTLDTTSYGGDYVIDLATGVIGFSYESFVNFENVVTGDGNDSITGTSGANMIFTGDGNDTINSGAGNDYIDGGAGADSMSGLGGNDSYVVDDAGDLVVEAGGSGTDQVDASISYTLTGNVENLVLVEGAGDINGNGNGSANKIWGNEGNNIINGRLGADSLYGGEGSDTYYVDDTGDRVYEDDVAGTDLVFSTVSFSGLGQYLENITLTGTADINATGNGVVNVLTGNSGANVLDGRGGADTMAGGAGNDTYTVENAGDVVVEASGGGTDTVNTSVSWTLGAGVYVEVINMTGGNSISVTGNSFVNTINGNSGNNLLDGAQGGDILSGGLGNDTYVYDNHSDVFIENAGEGTDWVRAFLSHTLSANIENLLLDGATGITGIGNALNNSIFGNGANNKLLGMDGNDYLDGVAGNDTMTGGLGDDTYTIDVLTDVIVEAASEGNDYVRSAISYTLGANLEILELLGTAANATGNALDNTLWGNVGNNVLDGLVGADVMIGDAGNDTYIVDNAGDIVLESNGGGTDVVNASVSYTLAAGVYVETFNLTGTANINATGNSLNTTINGNSGNNVINGGLGADTMVGGAGDDTYYVDTVGDNFIEIAGEGTDWVYSSINVGVSGQFVENIQLLGSANINANGQGLDNTIIGNSGNNTINASSGNDTVNGMGGNDILTGGAGTDTFVFTAGSAMDTINDFNTGQNDLININAYTHGVVNDPSVVITQVGGDVTIDLGGGNVITVIGATAAAPAFQSHIVW